MGKLLEWPVGRVSKWLVVVFWLLMLGVAAPYAGKLFGAASNDRVEYLPKNAESTKVLRAQDRMPEGKAMPAVVVYQRDSGLTAADRQRAAADQAKLAREFAPGAPASAPVAAQDGKALIYQLPLSAPKGESEGEVIVDSVDDMREAIGEGGGGLEIRVAGPAGLTADEFLIFRQVEFTLVLVPVVVVAVLLLLIYRSPVLFLVPLFSVAAANQVASAIVYGLIKGPGMVVNSMAISVLSILIYGAGTDYALLLIARYREELRRHDDRHDAMRRALRRSGPAILASAGTVVLGLLCLAVAELSSTRSLAPIGALAMLGAVLAMMTLLPALLVILGRWVFWPRVPHPGDAAPESRFWGRVAGLVSARPRTLWVASALVLAAGLIGVTGFNTPQRTDFPSKPEAVEGQEFITAHFAPGAGNPVDVVARADRAEPVRAAALAAGARGVQETGRGAGLVQYQVTLAQEPGSGAERAAVDRLRDRLHAVDGADALVGGQAAIDIDTKKVNIRDAKLAIPLILAVVMITLCVLLRAVVLSVLLIATVVLSFGAAMGISTLVFEHVFHWYGQDSQLPVLSFVFLVALGVDYNIFLMSRVREEAKRVGTRRGVLTGLVMTGGVITSAGVVLAATFSVLVALPVVGFAEQGFVVAVGILLDAFLVRSLLVPALTHDVGRRVWWPSRLARGAAEPPAREAELTRR